MKLNTPRNRRFWKKLPLVVFERNKYTGPIAGMLIGTLFGTMFAADPSPIVALLIIMVCTVLLWGTITAVTYLDMLHAKLDWWKGWVAWRQGQDFYDNPNDWVTKEEYDEEREEREE